MAIKKQVSLAASDITEIVLICRNVRCGSRLAFNLTGLKEIPTFKCPVCSKPANPYERERAEALRRALLGMQEELADARFDIRLGIGGGLDV
jgi:hypothetical protein